MPKPLKGYYDGLRGPVPCIMLTCWTNIRTRSLMALLCVRKEEAFSGWPYNVGDEIEAHAHNFVELHGQYKLSCSTIPIGDALGIPPQTQLP